MNKITAIFFVFAFIATSLDVSAQNRFFRGIRVAGSGITVLQGNVTLVHDSQIRWHDPHSLNDPLQARIWYDVGTNYLRVGNSDDNPWYSFEFRKNLDGPQGVNGIMIVRDGSAIQQEGVTPTATSPYLIRFWNNSVCISCGQRPTTRENDGYALTVADNMHVTTTGVVEADVVAPSSRSIKRNISNLDPDTALQNFNQLVPVEFEYLTAPGKRMGFIAEDVPSVFSSENHEAIGTMDIVAVLTKVVQEQQKLLDDALRRIAELEK